MKRNILFAALLSLASLVASLAHGQQNTPLDSFVPTVLRFHGAPPASIPCLAHQLAFDEFSGLVYYCNSLNLWQLSQSQTAAALPVYLNSGTPVSQTNECAAVTIDTSGNAVTAVAALRTIVGSVGHDVMCVVTADASLPANVGATFFPYVNGVSATAAPSQATPGVLEISNTGLVKAILTNTSNSVRSNGINFRSCVGGCGTDFRWVEDIAGIGNEDITWIGPSQAVLYATFNCPAGCATTFANSAGVRQFLFDDGTHDAKTNPEFALVKGHIAHGTTSSNATDTWATATCSGSTATVTFAAAFSNTTYQVLLTDQTTAGGARVSTKNVGSFVITCTGASDSVDYLVLGNPF